ncbi:hypothetical protein ACZ98_23770 (plasmid) [Vibrio parahaemolyticus]|nr:hypothetical protein ACZ98_23770 [Vibrio parahaemolyticus]
MAQSESPKIDSKLINSDWFMNPVDLPTYKSEYTKWLSQVLKRTTKTHICRLVGLSILIVAPFMQFLT